jgi:CRP/FNR family transcriptional regulator, nitrogen fixation regulation protein
MRARHYIGPTTKAGFGGEAGVFPTTLMSKAASLDVASPAVPFSCGRQLYGEGEPTDYVYAVATGIARCCRVSAAGRRQIVAFYVPGDLFGFEPGDQHTLSAEAVTEMTVCMVKRSTMMAVAWRDPGVAAQLWAGLALELRREQEHILRLGKPAQERMASCLLDFAMRLPNSGDLELPISRRDIADYLDITIETVSRVLTQLKNAAAITMSSTRRITIRNAHLLEWLASHVE